MSSIPPLHCARCHAPMLEAPEGLCPRCLMGQMLQPTADAAQPAATLPTAEELAPHFPQLEILDLLGRGGMGVVYKARQKSLNRMVALKLLAPERAHEPAFHARFEKEAHLLASLSHPNIVAIHDFGLAGGYCYLLMEYVDGVNLRQLMDARRLTPREALEIVPPVCEALQCAHDHGIVHRDIKPENLLLDKNGRVKMADFGVARMLVPEPSGPVEPDSSQENGATQTLPSQALGTPAYAAPEQAQGGNADHRADIYSLGVVLYEMLTGERPAAPPVQPPSKRAPVDVRIDDIVLKALHPSPELRFGTATEFRQQVQAATSPGAEAEVSDLNTLSADDANWYGYFFYFCRRDPRAVVPKRVGSMGWTMNFANAWSLPFMALLIGLVLVLEPVMLRLHAPSEVYYTALLGVVIGIGFLCHWMANPKRVREAGLSCASFKEPGVVALGTYVALLVYVWLTLPELPARTAMHFDAHGKANGWGSPQSHALYLCLPPLGTFLLCAVTTWLSWRFPKAFPLNVPKARLWAQPENRKESSLILGRHMLWYSTAFTLFFGSIHFLVLEANRHKPPYSSLGFIVPLAFGFVILALLGAVSLMRRYDQGPTSREPTR